MEASAIVTTALSTGVATALFNQGIAWWRETRKDNSAIEREARYLAIRLAVLLEDFAIVCADAISDQELHRSSEGAAGRPHGVLPELPPYPEGDWRVLDPEFLGRCLTLRNELKLSDGQINFWEDVGERDCIPQEFDEQAGKCGYRAWVLASDLRGHYRLAAFDPRNTAWDIVETLRSHHDAAVKRIRERNSS